MKHPANSLQTRDPGLRRRRRTLRRHWLALGTATACAAVVLSRPSAAQSPLPGMAGPGGSGRPASAPSLEVRRFNIPAGPLDAALEAFTRFTGVRVALALPPETISGFRSPGVAGLYGDRQALALLLEGTGLKARAQPDGSVRIALGAEESLVVSSDSAPVDLGLGRYAMPLLDTPQSVTVVTSRVMHEQAATTLRDVLRNAPGISLAAGEGGSQGDNLTLRGFTARNDIFLDGMRDFGSYYRDPFNYESVAVLEGPSSVSFGRGSTGGVINQESKMPGLDRFARVEGDLGTDRTRRLTADLNTPLPALGPGAALRLNGMAHDAGVAARDVVENTRFGVAPTLALGLGTPTRLEAGYFFFAESDIPDYGIPWYFNRPAPVARHNYYGFGSNYLDTSIHMGTVKAEHDIDGWATISNRIRYANNERHARITEPQLNTATSGAITPSTPLEQVQVNRNQIAVYSNESFLWDQLDATIHASTAGIRHVAVIGAEGGRETSDPRRPTYNYVNLAGQTVNSVPTTGLLSPDERQRFAGTAAPSSDVHVTSTSYGIYLLDTMEFGRHWEFSGGARFDRFYTEEKSVAYPTPRQAADGSISQGAPTTTYPSRLDRKPSWRGALIYKPVDNGSVYFAYGTSWNPSAEALALTVGPGDTGTANLAPEFNRSYEVGSKWDFNQSRLSLRADLFRTTKDTAREASPTNSLRYVLAGTQRVDGGELVASGRISEQWSLLASYTHMHSQVVSSKYYPAAVGAKLANVPDNLFNA
jgi:catecholate siderophore receptor